MNPFEIEKIIDCSLSSIHILSIRTPASICPQRFQPCSDKDKIIKYYYKCTIWFCKNTLFVLSHLVTHGYAFTYSHILARRGTNGPDFSRMSTTSSLDCEQNMWRTKLILEGNSIVMKYEIKTNINFIAVFVISYTIGTLLEWRKSHVKTLVSKECINLLCIFLQ